MIITPRDLGLLAAAAALLLDQASKLFLLYGLGFAQMVPGARAASLPGLSFGMAWNPGISFSFLAAQSPAGVVFLVLFAVIVIAVLARWMWQAATMLQGAGLGLVIGGAIGNLVDRAVYGHVADFIDVHPFGATLFVCNVADIAISLGAIAILYDAVFAPRPAAESRP